MIAALYLPVIFWLKSTVQTAFQIKPLFGIWSAGLSIGSIVGSYYGVPFLIRDISEYGLHGSICSNTYVQDHTMSHVLVIILISKFAEFGDTLFIVLRKSNLDFLHWYHHIATCIYSWNALYLGTSSGVYFGIINIFVHSIMYFYYSLMAFDIRILAPYKNWITILQTTQMGIGSYVIIVWFRECSPMYPASHWWNHVFALLMYISYGVLFTRLLLKNMGIKKIK
jgi:elongation of very long chain fatty acids protein 6